MRTDIDILNDIKAELQWDSRLGESNINTEVTGGHVLLTGSVTSYAKVVHAEEAARRVPGVKAVDNEIRVLVPESMKRSDKEIERSVKSTIEWNSSIDSDRIKVNVEDGWVTLEGETDWEYQRSKARLLAEDIAGVRGITNLIKVSSNSVTSSDIRERIEHALKRNNHLDGKLIKVEVAQGKAILKGHVRTLAEKLEAETAAWSAPGITEVINELVVDYSELYAKEK